MPGENLKTALEWAQEARSYSMVLFLTTLASYLLVRGLHAPSPTTLGVACAWLATRAFRSYQRSV